MSKVKITEQQAEAIEEIKGGVSELFEANLTTQIKKGWLSNAFTPLNELSTKDYLDALYIGYEIKQEFKVGDWIYINKEATITNKPQVKKIVGINKGIVKFDDDWVISINSQHIRHATPEEIAEEKERRWWVKHGREVWELRDGDVIRRHTTCHVVYRSMEDNNGDLYIDFYEHGSVFTIKELRDLKSKVVCFAEDRKDE